MDVPQAAFGLVILRRWRGRLGLHSWQKWTCGLWELCRVVLGPLPVLQSLTISWDSSAEERYAQDHVCVRVNYRFEHSCVFGQHVASGYRSWQYGGFFDFIPLFQGSFFRESNSWEGREMKTLLGMRRSLADLVPPQMSDFTMRASSIET